MTTIRAQMSIFILFFRFLEFCGFFFSRYLKQFRGYDYEKYACKILSAGDRYIKLSYKFDINLVHNLVKSRFMDLHSGS